MSEISTTLPKETQQNANYNLRETIARKHLEKLSFAELKKISEWTESWFGHAAQNSGEVLNEIRELRKIVYRNPNFANTYKGFLDNLSRKEHILNHQRRIVFSSGNHFDKLNQEANQFPKSDESEQRKNKYIDAILLADTIITSRTVNTLFNLSKSSSTISAIFNFRQLHNGTDEKKFMESRLSLAAGQINLALDQYLTSSDKSLLPTIEDVKSSKTQEIQTNQSLTTPQSNPNSPWALLVMVAASQGIKYTLNSTEMLPWLANNLHSSFLLNKVPIPVAHPISDPNFLNQGKMAFRELIAGYWGEIDTTTICIHGCEQNAQKKLNIPELPKGTKNIEITNDKKEENRTFDLATTIEDLRSKRFDQAIEAIKAALRDPKVTNNQINDLVTVINDQITDGVIPPKLYGVLGRCYQRLGDYTNAETCFNNEIALGSGYGDKLLISSGLGHQAELYF
jgi:tetratricopeptide (TPR) repeat protein